MNNQLPQEDLATRLAMTEHNWQAAEAELKAVMAGYQEQLRALTAERDALRVKVEAIEEKVRALEAERDSARRERDAARAESKRLSSDFRDAENALRDKTKETADLATRLELAEGALRETIARLMTVPANYCRPMLCEGDFERWNAALATPAPAAEPNL